MPPTLINTVADFCAKLVILLGSEKFFNPDCFEVGVERGLLTYGTTEFVYFGLSYVDEVYLNWYFVDL